MVKHLSSQSNTPVIIFVVLLLVPAFVIVGFVVLANQRQAQATTQVSAKN